MERLTEQENGAGNEGGREDDSGVVRGDVFACLGGVYGVNTFAHHPFLVLRDLQCL